ncbi:unnamed protein product, partial [Heterosigma akashiwo]
NIIRRKPDGQGFMVDEGIPFLSEAEMEGINRISKLGFWFSNLKDFVKLTTPNYKQHWEFQTGNHYMHCY